MNSLLFIVYQQAHPSIPPITQVWEYFESDIFKGLTAGLLFPIFLFLLERRFKIIEKREEDRKERQLESIKESSVMWNEFYSLINEVIFFRKRNNNINDTLKRLEDSKSRIADLTNSWKSRFSNITSEDIDMLFYFDNMLYFATNCW